MASSTRRPKAKDAPQGDQDPKKDIKPSRDEAKIIRDLGDPAKLPDEPGVENEAREAPEQGRDNELHEKRKTIGAVTRAQPVHNRAEIESVVTGVNGGTLEISTAQGVVTVRADKKVVLDQNGAADAMRTLERAFQAVS